jgi:tripartite-type tricarboxylate transporter receptor subunit TctC
MISTLLLTRPHGCAAGNSRPITLIVPWGAGGGTDAVARMIGSLMEKDLGQPVNVVNRTGGSGVVGHSAIASGGARRLHDRHDHGGESP